MSSRHLQKAYVPIDTRTVQYISAEFHYTSAIEQAFSSLDAMTQAIFTLADEAEIFNCHIIANDKLPLVRHNSESYCIENANQVFIFYNPSCHEARNLIHTADQAPRKIRILCLATGDDIRATSANFHIKVQQLIAKFKQATQLELDIKIRDHQHLAYDMFARHKGNKQSFGYKFRALPLRYQARECVLPTDVNSLNFVTVSLPLSRALIARLANDHNIASLYQGLEDKFSSALDQSQIKHAAMVANGQLGLVRNSKFSEQQSQHDVVMLGFDPSANDLEFVSHWQADKLVATAEFILVARANDQFDSCYGRFVNQVEQLLQQFAKDIGLNQHQDELMIRFHQHLSYLA
ncbi:DUF3083 family protein [Shewanella sp. NIFS-20-20]|uniref:DUF3083 family protein n=1 Tax=Shewanella sp. NIFS-20-20 TaxID=2853806 RepID=UPI001C48EA2E|nr:DUF3083 family protein [Shewanella sp. NIFS-20-20]MBV7316853.1 DUF3083 family protein [Shewanella sp. NIFS-20-20]